MVLFVSLAAGPQVLKKAQISDRATTSRNWAQGKKTWTSAWRKRLNWRSMVYPTAVPIRTPSVHELRTRTSDS